MKELFWEKSINDLHIFHGIPICGAGPGGRDRDNPFGKWTPLGRVAEWRDDNTTYINVRKDLEKV